MKTVSLGSRPALAVAALLTLASCGAEFGNNLQSGDGGPPRDTGVDPTLDGGDGAAGDGDAAGDGATSPCQTLGDVRFCKTASAADGAQTCTQ